MLTSFGRSVEKREMKKANKIADKAYQLFENKYKNYTLNNIIFEQEVIKNKKDSDEKIIESLAIFKQASTLILGLTPFQVQDVAAYVLYKGCVAEMKTGEGKTLVALIASYLSYMDSRRCHVVTVNDYLAKRDFEFSKSLFDELNITVSVLLSDDNDSKTKSDNYKKSDIVYSSNVSLGFDYLKSNLVKDYQEKIIDDIEKCFVIVDEVDSVLIDEAKSPLIISGENEGLGSDIYNTLMKIALKMEGQVINKDESSKTAFEKLSSDSEEYSDFHYVADKKTKRAHMTEKGYHFFEEALMEEGLISSYNDLYKGKINFTNFMEMCLSAISLYQNGVDYIVLDEVDEGSHIQLIDQGTGRIMKGRMLSNGLHQAIESKENKEISKESKTIAEITYQNLFRLFYKLSGMTGTAYEDKKELEDIYGLPVCQIPTRLPIKRIDEKDVLVENKEEKIKLVIEEIIDTHKTKQPILVGTSSVNDSEIISSELIKKGLKVEVLNAKNHERESEIIANAGRKGAITISTSMAGRGTDIILGGNPNYIRENISNDILKEEQKFVKEVGGLYVIGFERNKSRRVDDQLKGRAGRQGDPGRSRFYVSLDDELFQIFGSGNSMERMKSLVFSDSTYVTGVSMLDNAIHKAQRRASRYEFDIRLSLLKFDDVMDKQRRSFYSMRDKILRLKSDYIDINNGYYVSELTPDLEQEIIYNISPICDEFKYITDIDSEKDLDEIKKRVLETIGFELNMELFNQKMEISKNKDRGEVIFDTVIEQINERKAYLGSMAFYSILKIEKLNVMDGTWSDLIESGSVIKKSVGLRGYAQKKPEDEYKKETWDMFNKDIVMSSTFNAMKNIVSD